MIYAITEIAIFLLLAALLGLFVGYMLWYRRAVKADAEADAMAISLQDRTARLGLAEQDVESLIDERDRVRAESLSLANAADRSAAEVATLRGHVAQIQPLADRVPKMRSKLESLLQEMEALRAERDQLVTDSDVTVDEDERTSQQQVTDHESGEPASFVGSEPVELLRQDPDDLQRISGIGPHLEQLLNHNSIFTYRQIAKLSEVGLRDLDDQLGFKGRIKRDSWQSQATDLHNEKFGEPPP